MRQVGGSKHNDYENGIINTKNHKCGEQYNAIVKGIQVVIAEFPQGRTRFGSLCLHPVQMIAKKIQEQTSGNKNAASRGVVIQRNEKGDVYKKIGNDGNDVGWDNPGDIGQKRSDKPFLKTGS